MFSIHNESQLKALLANAGEPSFRYAQIENALYKNAIEDIEQMSTISKKAKELLTQNCFFYSIKLKDAHLSQDGQTTKFLFEAEDGGLIESVVMRHLSGRNTVCVSCQIGCPMKCAFCSTGAMGLTRNLAAHEIVEQIMFCAKWLEKEDKRLRNVVFMGMGEPFANYEEISGTLAVLFGEKKLNFSDRRITISTCGIIPGILQLAKDHPQISLAISLHAPEDSIRNIIMPVNKTYPLDELMKTLDEYVAQTNKRVFYEYILIKDLNDTQECAHKLGRLLQGRLAHVNLIPYNPGQGLGSAAFEKPTRASVLAFQETVKTYGTMVTLRHTMGDDIAAACGQLAAKNKKTLN